MDWLTENKIPVGKWAGAVFDWLQMHGGWFFDALSDAHGRCHGSACDWTQGTGDAGLRDAHGGMTL